MNNTILNNITKKVFSNRVQFLISIVAIILLSFICFISVNVIGYKVVALLLLLLVSLLAMVFDILPVLIAASLSAAIWNFFFIPPILTFHINSAEDALLFLMYFFVATVNAVLTFKIRQAEKKARDKEEKKHTIRLYNTLLNSLSHELKTPIATIIGSVDTLKENQNNLSSLHRIELLSELEIAGLRLNRQVENLLNMSRLETGSLQLKKDWCDVNELVFTVIQTFSNTKKHTILFKEKDTLPLFKIDIGLIEQVLQNIIHNAIQYTPENTIITIDVEHKKENCVITITDTGKGFQENEYNVVFDKFYRSPNTKAGGTGLGLSIVKGFIEAHNGTIELENNIPNGAKFSIQIPAESSYINNLKNE
ncbi:MAG: sensor histidine kinase [Chitinophagaceae bacterium]